MPKNKKVMSIAIKPELHEDLKKFSKRKGISASNYIGNLVEQALKINPDDDPIVFGKPVEEDVMPVILLVPTRLVNNFEKITEWMNFQSAKIIQAIYKNMNDWVIYL